MGLSGYWNAFNLISSLLSGKIMTHLRFLTRLYNATLLQICSLVGPTPYFGVPLLVLLGPLTVKLDYLEQVGVKNVVTYVNITVRNAKCIILSLGSIFHLFAYSVSATFHSSNNTGPTCSPAKVFRSKMDPISLYALFCW